MASGIDSDAAYIPAVNFTDASVDPTAPILGHSKLYVKNGGVYVLHHTGPASLVGAAPTLATNSLGVGDGSGLLAPLAVGATGAVPTRQADGTVAEIVPTGGGGGDLVKLATWTAGAGAGTTHTFSAIPGTYSHLRLVGTGRSDNASNPANIAFTLNGDGGQNYYYNFLYLAAAAISVAAQQEPADNFGYLGNFAGANSPGGAAGSVVADFLDYAQTTFWKSCFALSGAIISSSSPRQRPFYVNSVWKSTAAITSLTVKDNSGTNFVAGSRFVLYGIN